MFQQHERRHTFQSTLSVRRATGVYRVGQSFDCISIHALREESDPISMSVIGRWT